MGILEDLKNRDGNEAAHEQKFVTNFGQFMNWEVKFVN